MDTTAPAAPRAYERWAALGGLVYVVLFVVGAILSFGGQPDTDEPEKMIRYFSDAGHRDRLHFGWLLIVISVFFFLWFVGALRRLTLRYAGDGVLATVVSAGGAAYAATTLVGIALEDAIKTMSDDTYRDTVYPELIHAADDAGYVIHASGGAALGALIVAVSLAALGARAIPTWLGWLSILCGLLAIVSVFFFPFFVIAIWLVVASILVFRAFSTAPQGAQSAPR